MKKKVKRFQGGGLSGIADTANSLIGEVDDMANTIKYGSGARSGQQPLGFLGFNGQKPAADPSLVFPAPRTNTKTTSDFMTVEPAIPYPYNSSAKFKDFAGALSGQKTFKKGGKVKMSSASKRADGIATKGKTRGKMV